MVDQPSHKSYKIRGHSRQRKNSKPYTRPSEPKNKGLLDKVKDYLSPSWLFGYFTSNEDEPGPSNLEDDVLDQNSTVTHEEGSISSTFAQQQGRLSSLDEENDDNDDAFGGFEMNNDRILLDDKSDKSNAQGVEENTKRERVENAESSIRLSGSLNDDLEDESERRSLGQSDKPHSVLSYSTEQLTRKPLPSLLHSRPLSSSLLQRGMPSLHSQGNSLLGSVSLRSTLNTPSVKFSTPLTSSSASFLNTSKPNSSLSKPSILSTRNSLRDNNFTRSELSTVDDTRKVNTETMSTTAPSVSTASSMPLFSVEKFVTPVQRTFKNKRVGSPNYPGPIMYGGALNVSRDVPFKRRRTSSPGSETYHPVSKLRIRGVKERPIQNSTFGGNGTRTAQRILDALESVSSPLKDVRRIPSPISLASASPLSFMPSKTRTTPPKTKVGPRVSYLQAKLLGKPPVSSLQTPDVAKVSFVENSVSKQPQPSSPPPPTNKHSTHSVEEQSLFSGLKDTVLKSSLPTSFAPKSLPTSLSPVESTNKSSGKMRTAPRSGAMHYSSNNNQEDEVVNPLPEIRNAVPLPLNSSKKMSLPMFDSNKIMAKESENVSNKRADQEPSSRDKLLTESPKNGFIFSSPEPKSRPFSVKETLEIADDEVSFSFSEPVPVKKSFGSTKENFKNPLLHNQKTSNDLKATWSDSLKQNINTTSLFANSPSDATQLGDWNCSPCMATNKAADQKFSACGKNNPPAEKHSSDSAQANDLAQRFAPAAGSWECTSCMLNNAANAVKCVACETAKPSKGKDKPDEDLKVKFVAPKDTWESKTCLIRNKDDLDKCAACQTSRPGAKSNDDMKVKFAAPSGSWESPTCMIQNKATDSKCVACATSKPGASSNDDLKLKFAAPSGSWECPTCMIQNNADDSKCVACATSKPGAENGGSTQSSFSLNNTSTTKSGFTFGGDTTTSSGFTFGSASTDQSSSESSKPTFTFGNNTVTTSKHDSTFSFSKPTTDDTKPTSGFTFGGNSNERPSTVAAFKFGDSSSKEESAPSPFSFGAGNVGKTSNENESLNKAQGSETPSEKPSNTPTMNIAQAAAAGLLKVPGKDTTPSTGQAASEQLGIKPFTFGATTAPSGGSGDGHSTCTVPSSVGLPILTSSTDTQSKPFAFQVSSSSAASTKTAGSVFSFGAEQSSATTLLAVSTSAAKASQAVFSFTPSNKPLFSFTGSNPAAVSLPSVAATSTVSNKPFSFIGSTSSASSVTSNSAASINNTSVFNFIGSNSSVTTTATTNQPSLFNFIGSPSTNTSAVVKTLPSSQSNLTSLFPPFTGSTQAAADKSKATPVFNFGSVNGPTSSNVQSTTAGPTPSSAASFFPFSGAQASSGPVVENQNSMGGEEMDADSNSNHDQATFPQPGGFHFNTPTPGSAPGLFPAGTSGIPGGNAGGFNFSGVGGSSSSFSFANVGTPSGGFNFGVQSTAGSSPFVFGGAPTTTSGPTNPSNTAGMFNFGGATTNPADKPQSIVGQNSEQPALFSVGASQTPPSSRIIKKAVRRARR